MDRTVGVVLAGGRSRRMGGTDKSLLTFLDRPLLHRILERFAPQVEELLLSANGELSRFQTFPLRVVADHRSGQPGPLAGIEAAFLACDADWLVTVPVDLPFLPLDLVQRLWAAKGPLNQPAVASSRGRIHPVIALWPRAILPAIRAALDAEQRRMLDLLARLGHQIVEFPALPDGQDPFFNVNDPASLEQARQWIASISSGTLRKT
ncbi:MAG: molybdenum cofactor guanylyltransferase [Magnetococcales bacterium]|nr:molybdenum cofactor guanylyltransferase [Magnetococcales bacterium]